MSVTIQITEDDLPMLSAVATQAIILLNHPNVTNSQINDLIRQDPALASRVLHIANSAFYGGRFQVRKISDAIVRMGLRQLRNILVVAATGELFNSEDPIIRSLWDHSMAVAAVSDKLAGELDIPDSEEAFIAGLVHDIGKFMIYRQHPGAYAEVVKQSAASGRRHVAVEHEAFQFFTHSSIGGIVTNKWRLAEPVSEAARFHHRFEDAVPKDVSNRNLVAAVSFANVLVNMHGLGIPFCDFDGAAKLACTQHLKLPADHIRRLFDAVAPICRPQDQSKALEA